MAGYASRWDRYYPKAFELTANHRFSVTGLAAEVNLLATRGRGTLPRRIAQTVRAAQWAQGFPSSAPRKLRANAPRLAACEDAVVQGSSTRQLLPDSSIDLVLTDPPYFDDVQYAELGSMFLVWAQAIGLIPKSVHVDLRSEAVPNTVRGVTGERYRHILTAVLRETRRTLRPSGRMVLTFHNTDGHAWWALARALGNAGFHVSALAVAHAENETDHSKRGRRAFSHDLVLECRPQPVAEAEIVIAATPNDPQARELLAAGLTVAQLAGRLADGRATRASSYRTFSRSYRQHLGEPAGTYIHFAAPRTKSEAHR
jgi:adenine-specific DNA methylase